ncbi:uncharacterized protein ASPGLDRAFT_39906 [Aspergillus glaucus CBS 516.65]|uniref:Uncharacterized protein n=1 Tax=Aspergillus glaucus CBS 516.65 TaxID=1160497 RepID=A0A1L9V681_ASPGL|nr:hypothetical protein ASPGLDRAFT_39906 [Aspergillus glaucus CBS 516.65]OJJ79389.1 hypothetical protein ASPGLDRAFT_39906 [Aspergillus glaucus CBS 516.65]
MLVHFDTFPCAEVTDAMLVEAANSDNYGIWGPGSYSPGMPMKLNARSLQEWYLPESSNSL